MNQEDFYDSLEEEFSSASSLTVATAKRCSISRIPTLKERHREESMLPLRQLEELSSPSEDAAGLPKETASSLEESTSPLEESTSPLEDSISPLEGSISPLEESASPLAGSVSPLEGIVSANSDGPATSTASEDTCYCFKNEDVAAIVPFYGGEKFKSEIDSFVPKKPLQRKMRSDRSFKSVSKQSLSSLSDRFFNKSYKGDTLSGIDSIERPAARSYLEMFQARNGYQPNAKKCLEDTTRSLFGDSEVSLVSTSTSDRDAFKDAEDSPEMETASMYLNTILESAGSAREYSVSRGSSASPKLSTVSDLFLDQMGQRKSKNTKNSKRRLAPLVPVNLGGLGPDVTANQDKLERRKKQLSYGEKVSKMNRIKMMEINALKKLKEEMKNSAAL